MSIQTWRCISAVFPFFFLNVFVETGCWAFLETFDCKFTFVFVHSCVFFCLSIETIWRDVQTHISAHARVPGPLRLANVRHWESTSIIRRCSFFFCVLMRFFSFLCACVCVCVCIYCNVCRSTCWLPNLTSEQMRGWAFFSGHALTPLYYIWWPYCVHLLSVHPQHAFQKTSNCSCACGGVPFAFRGNGIREWARSFETKSHKFIRFFRCECVWVIIASYKKKKTVVP